MITKKQLDTLPAPYENLFKLASEAKENAYSPYSKYKVGAALLMKDGKIINGCNVENASYGLTMCAERIAIFKAVSEGYKPGDIEAIAIVASAPDFSPCGACRQVINEFGVDIKVIFEFSGRVVLAMIKELLPCSFEMGN